MPILLALVAGVSFGASDFLGGIGGRRVSVGAVVFAQQPFALLGTIVAVAFYRPSSPTEHALAWGAVSGLGNGIGTIALYRGLALGQMRVVAPVSAVLTAGIPVVAGIALGDRPSALEVSGMALAVPAIMFLSSSRSDGERYSGIWEGLAAGACFGLFLIALDRAGTASGAWPLLPGQAVTVALVLPLGLWMSRNEGSRRPAVRYGAAAGILGALATLAFLTSTGAGELAVVAVLTSLYPAVTVLLAWIVLDERWNRIQGLGLAAAAFSIALISAGSAVSS